MNSVEASAFLLPRGWKTVFEAFSPFPRDWKTVLRHFFSFGRGRNTVFAVFPVSAVAETLFLLFSTHPPWRKADFQRFLSVVPLRKAIFAVFY